MSMGEREKKQIKCLIWDLDRTLWEGVLSEGGAGALRPGVREALAELDRRGVLLSIASRNEPGPAMAALEELGVADYFLCPQINWGDKGESVRRIGELLNLKPEALALIDDSPFERDGVRHALPQVTVYPETAVEGLLARPELTPRFVTETSAARRSMYRADLARREAQEGFSGSSEEFLKTLDIHVAVAPVGEGDLQRVEELTVRTHQLNSTGYTYSYEELTALAGSPDHIFLVCSMKDRYGDNGKVGLLLAKVTGDVMKIELLIVSCRVMSYGIGSGLLAYAVGLAKRMGKRLQADFLQTEHNRIMYITYKFAGFEEAGGEGDRLLLEYAGEEAPALPAYLNWDDSAVKLRGEKGTGQ